MPDMQKLSLNGNTYDIRDSRVDGVLEDIADLQTDKEDINNKTDVLDQDSTSSQYPNAECVYNAIQAADKFVPVTYGTTSYADVDAIVSAGKIPYVFYNNTLFTYQIKVSIYLVLSAAYYMSGSKITSVFVDTSNTWGNATMQSTPTINASSTNLYFPTAKGVYDYASPVLYRHNVELDFGSRGLIHCQLITSSSTPYTSADFGAALVTLYGSIVSTFASGDVTNNLNENCIVTALAYDDGNNKYRATGFNEDSSPGYMEHVDIPTSALQDFDDTVTRV